MERRRYLRSLAVAVGIIGAGCSSAKPGDRPTEPATPIPKPTLTRAYPNARQTEEPNATARPRTGSIPEAPVARSMTGWEHRSYDTAEADDSPPRVEFEPDDDRLSIRGVIAVGSGTCKRAAVQEIEFDDGELDVRVRHDYVETKDGERPRKCTDDISTDAYEVEVTFDDGLPARIVAEERDYHAEERRTVYER